MYVGLIPCFSQLTEVGDERQSQQMDAQQGLLEPVKLLVLILSDKIPSLSRHLHDSNVDTCM